MSIFHLMRILYVHERFGALGGAEANACITAGELKGRGHKIGLLHGPSTGRGEAVWHNTFEDCAPLREASTGDAARAMLKSFRPDLIYTHKMADLEVIGALVKSGLPLVRMVHDHDIYCMRSYKYFYRSRKICARAASAFCVFGCGAFLARNPEGRFPVKYVSYRGKLREIELNHRFDRMVVVSQYMRQELLKNRFESRKIEIHPPVPRAVDTTIRSSFSDRNLILYVGQIIRGKGVDVLLKALAKIKTRFECVILGDGSHKKYCENLSRELGLEGKVLFKGFIPQDELKHYYGECGVVALSSVWPEPIATVGMEVMRYGLPVVAFDAGGIKDWLIDGVTGYLIPWMDIDQYAARIEELLNDKAKAKWLGQNALESVSKKFNFENYISDLETMFATVIAEKKLVGALEAAPETSRG